MIESAILTEIVTATNNEMPSNIKNVDLLLRKVCKNASQSVWNNLSTPANNYLTGVVKAIKSNAPIPMPTDLEDKSTSAAKQKRKPKEDQPNEDIILDFSFECKTTVELSSIRGLLEMKDSGLVRIPDFQRNYVWSPQAQYTYLKGILGGMSVSTITLAIDDQTNERYILDGLQRTETLHRFFNDQILIDKKFKFSKMSDKVKNKFLTTKVTIAECQADKQYWPEIFQFINRNGTPLTDIEIWRAIYQHDLLSKIESVSTDHVLWAEIYGRAKDKRFKGMYLLLRAVAMRTCYQEYQKPMARFLANFCKEIERNPTMVDANQIHSDIDRILFGIRNHGKTIFRTTASGQVNIGMVDCILHAGFEAIKLRPQCTANNLHDWLGQVSKELLEDQKILATLTFDTSGNENVLLRMKKSEEIINKILAEN